MRPPRRGVAPVGTCASACPAAIRLRRHGGERPSHFQSLHVTIPHCQKYGRGRKPFALPGRSSRFQLALWRITTLRPSVNLGGIHMPRFNPPPNWPPPPPGWTPPPGWQPDPALPPPPPEWQLWVDDKGGDTARTWWIRGTVGALWLVFLISGVATEGFAGFLYILGLSLCVISLVIGVRGRARSAGERPGSPPASGSSP